MKSKLKNQSGFTIIEVLIVLAIAGLIMLIVFLAVPALQRNNRNTAIRNDVQKVLGGIPESQSANNGAMPTNIAGTGIVTYTGGGSTPADTQIEVQGTTIVALGGTHTTAGRIQVELGVDCNGGVRPRGAAAHFTIETQSVPNLAQCADS